MKYVIRIGIVVGTIFCCSVVGFASDLILSVEMEPKSAMRLFSKKKTIMTRPGQMIDLGLIQRDIDSIYLTGYFSDVTYEIQPFKSGKKLIFKATPNPRLSQIRFQGVKEGDVGIFKSVMSNQRGNILNFKSLIEDKKMIEQWYEDRGFRYATIDQMKLDENVLNIRVSEGRIAKTSWDGLNKIKGRLLNRHLRQRKGTVFQDRKANLDRKQLLETDFFSQVSKPIVTKRKNGLLEVEYWVKEKNNNAIDFGIEQLRFEDSIAVFGGLQWRNAIIDSDKVNLKAQYRLGDSATLYSYGLYYQQPWLFNRYKINTKLSLWNEFRREPFSGKTIAIENERQGASLSFERPIFSEDMVLILGSRYEDVNPVNNDFDGYQIRSIKTGFRWDKRDDFVNPREGYLINTTIESGGDFSFIDVRGLDFSRMVFNAAGFLPISDRSVIAARLFYGDFYTEDIQDTFESEAFYLGGSNSLRGYRDLAFTGNRRLSSSFEYRYELQNPWVAVLFVDIGKAYDRGTFLSESFQVGYGAGIRFLTGLLPIRFDLAYGDEWHLHFNLGHTF